MKGRSRSYLIRPSVNSTLVKFKVRASMLLLRIYIPLSESFTSTLRQSTSHILLSLAGMP